MPQQHPFQSSFWSPTSSIDTLPNFTLGFNVLHKKLQQSMSENKVITAYIQDRINVEKSHAEQLSSIVVSKEPFEMDIGGGLKRCFEIIYSESQESFKEHQTRAENLNTTALDPLVQFSHRYERIIQQSKLAVEAQVAQFDILCKQMEQTKQYYQNRCKTLLVFQPEYKHSWKVGRKLEFSTREEVWIWLKEGLEKENKMMTKTSVLKWLSNESEKDALEMLQSLEQLEFLKLNHSNDMIEINHTADAPVENQKGSFAGFLGRWGNSGQQIKKEELVADMLEADKQYRSSVEKVELMRTQIEQILFVHYEEMESLELERIQTIKHAFISVAASLSNTIPRCKETFDNMMLYQETLEPDKDVQFIVEQYRTGQYNPRPILYENYFEGTAKGKNYF